MHHKKDSFFEDLQEEISFEKPTSSTPTSSAHPRGQGRLGVTGEVVHTHGVSRSSRHTKRQDPAHTSRHTQVTKRDDSKRSSHVIEAREQMSAHGVATIVFIVDRETHALLGPIRLETRGLAEVHEARNIHRLLIKAARDSYEMTFHDVPDIEEKDLLKIIRADVSKVLIQDLRRNPMVIPVIVSV